MSVEFKYKRLLLPVIFLVLCLVPAACSDKVQVSTQTTASTHEASLKPLIAAIPEKSIYLYANKEKGEGVILKVGGREQEFNWPYMTPRFILPAMQAADYDGDGKEELAVILYVGSGTGVSVEDLHMVDIAKGEAFEDHIYNCDDYIAQLEKEVSFKTMIKAGQLMGQIAIGTERYTVDLKDYQTKEYEKINEKLVLGSIVRFQAENSKLTVEFGVGINSESFVPASYIGGLHADVLYGAGKFQLKNLRFEENPQ